LKRYQGIAEFRRKRPFFTHLFGWAAARDSVLAGKLQVRRMEMSNEIGSRVRHGEAFWRAHHEAWQQSTLNQREYCEAHGVPLKAFGNWRAKFKAEPQPWVRKLLYRRRGLSHNLSHSLSHMTYGCAEPIVPPARQGHRRKFSEADSHVFDAMP
jgi:hypothetical protein